MFCEKCGGELLQDKKLLVCQKCGAEYGLDYSEGYNATYSVGGEQVTLRGFASKRNIIIIVIAALLVLGGVGAAVAIGVSNRPAQTALSGIQLSEKYLSEQNYEQAIIAFEQVLDIEPMNVDAYLGLAEAYLGLGNKEKAIEVLRRGLEMTGDARIQAKLDELLNEEENISDVTESESEDSTTLKLSWAEMDGNIVYSKFGHYLRRDGNLWRPCDPSGSYISERKYKYIEDFCGTEENNYSIVKFDDGKVAVIDKDYQELFEIENPDRYIISDQKEPLIVSWHVHEFNNDNDKDFLRVYSPNGEHLYSWNQDECIDGSGKPAKINDSMFPDEVRHFECGEKYHENLWCDSIECRLYTDTAVRTTDNNILVSFSCEFEYNWDRTKEIEAFNAERDRVLASGGIWTGALNTYSHYATAQLTYNISLEKGKLVWVKNDLVSSYTKLGYSSRAVILDDSCIMLIDGCSITPTSYFYLVGDNINKRFLAFSDYERKYDLSDVNFHYINRFVNKDLMLCGKYTDDTRKNARVALFRINWEDMPELDNDSNESVYYNNGEGILNDGNERISDFYDYFSYSDNDLALGYALVGNDDKWGYISIATGKELAMFDDASNFSNGYAIVTINGKGHIIDSAFNTVSDEFPCDSASTIGDGSFRVSVGDTVKRLVIEK